MISYYTSIVETDEEKDKIEYIYKNFYSSMAYTAGRVLNHNKQDVEDTVHNAMLKIIDIIDKIDITEINKVKNLCGIIARNKAKDHCKLKENQTVSLDEDLITDGNENDIDPVKIVVNKEIYDIVLRSIYTLNDNYRDVCILKYVHGYKTKDIALILDISPNIVSTRIFRGKEAIKNNLRKEHLDV